MRQILEKEFLPLHLPDLDTHTGFHIDQGTLQA